MKHLKFIGLIYFALILVSCESSLKEKDTFISTEIKQPFVSLDSISISKKQIDLYITDSLAFFNPTTNGQSIAVVCEQNDLINKDFDFLNLHIHMPIRKEGGMSAQFTVNQYMELRSLYFNDSLKDFYSELLELNWNTRNNYNKNFMTLLDRVNMTFQEEIRNNYLNDFPGGSDWYGYNAFIIFNNYLLDSKNEKVKNIVNSLNSSPNRYLVESDIEQLMELIKKYKN